ncbi:acyltransferase [Paraflavisolibacter sp. H34]|uniref:acyltransferase n=1 Tax=Huijunlia imazamoxiresistens TaxID=3127457 RepID=UPI003017EB8E
MQRSTFIDFARGFSILTIVIFHFLQWHTLPLPFSHMIKFGGAGIHLFFFASGFGLACSSYTTFGSFLKRRFQKVLTPYYIAVTFIFLINLVFRVYDDGLPEYISHLLLYKMFVPEYEGSLGWQLWFISTIIQFYLLFPLLLRLLNSGRYKAILAVSLVISLGYGMALSYSPYAQERVFTGFFLQFLWEFMLGMVVARKRLLDKLIHQPLYYYILAAAGGTLMTYLLAVRGGTIGVNLNDIFSFVAYSSIVVLLYRKGKALHKFIFWITGFSFSLYLMHMLVLDVLLLSFQDFCNSIYFIPLSLTITLLFSYYYDLLVNKLIQREWAPMAVQRV